MGLGKDADKLKWYQQAELQVRLGRAAARLVPARTALLPRAPRARC